MEQCEVCRLIEAQYRRAKENALEAKRQLQRATTAAQAECAAAWLRRAEEHWLEAINELLATPRSCACELPELADIFADYRAVEAAGTDPQPVSAYIQ
ncbi:MAG: hypothetical protein ACLQVN_00990 [Bryobacteraceae bacterium]